MAPRRGGGGGGGGDDGGGSGLNSPWGDKYQFYGSKFTDPIIRGTIIIQAICVFALVMIAVAAAFTKKAAVSSKKNPGSAPKIFVWSRYYFSIAMAIIAIGSSLAFSIISDSEFVVRRIYILINTILSDSYYLAEIFLLATIYWLLAVHFLSSGTSQQTKPTKAIRALELVHRLFLLVLLGLWVGIMYTSIKVSVDLVEYDRDFNLAKTWSRLNLAYTILYLCATIEIIVWAVIAFGKRKTEIRNLVIFVALVAIPLFIRSCISTGVAARTQEHDITLLTAFIDLFFSDVCIVLAYGGIVLIARRLEFAQRPYRSGDIMAAPPPLDPQHIYSSHPNQWQQPGAQDLPGGQEFNNSSRYPQMQGSAYTANAAANNPSGPSAGEGYHHPNGYAPVPQQAGGGGGAGTSDSFHSVPTPRPY